MSWVSTVISLAQSVGMGYNTGGEGGWRNWKDACHAKTPLCALTPKMARMGTNEKATTTTAALSQAF